MLDNTPKIISTIKNSRKILIFGKGSNIERWMFSGLNFQHYELLDQCFTIEDLIKYKDTEYDYFFIHGYELRFFDTTHLLKNNIQCKIFSIDLLGEGFDIDQFIYEITEKTKNLICNKIKILIPFSHYNNLDTKFRKIEFFKIQFGGPKVFCSRYNRQMIHGTYYKNNEEYESVYSTDNVIEVPNDEIIVGLEWSDKIKNKIFMCLTGTPRAHRTLLIDYLIKKNLIQKGFVSFPSDKHNFIYDNSENGNITGKINFEIPQLRLDENLFEGRFSLHSKISKNSYVDLVVESSHNFLPFKTEKCVKPFYNLQFPIILGHNGIIDDLRNEGFDMFDDIINHQYDLIPSDSENCLITKNLNQKCKLISDELEKFCSMDINELHQLYLSLKDRFIYNQELLYKKTIEQNDLHRNLAHFIFEDDIEVKETDFDKIKRIYI